MRDRFIFIKHFHLRDNYEINLLNLNFAIFIKFYKK